MELAATLRLKESFARTAMEKLVEEHYTTKKERKKALELFDAAQATSVAKIAKHVPNIDPEQGPAHLNALGIPRAKNEQRQIKPG